MASSWPPESLSANPVEILNECELMELLPHRGEGKQYVPVVELATFLFTGELVHARHVWRRWRDNNPPSLLLDWWKVGAAMMSSDPKTLWEGLAYIQSNHPVPLSSYAQEVAIAYRKRILKAYPATQPYLELLNFASPQELQQFCNHHVQNDADGTNHKTNTTSLRQVVSFLEKKATQIVKT